MTSIFIHRTILFVFSLFVILPTAAAQFQDTIYMCSNWGTNQLQITHAPNGLLYDSGGPNGSYSNNEHCDLLIDPSCALSIAFTILEVNTENCCDYLEIRDGDNISSPYILAVGGDQLSNVTFTGTSGKLFLRWQSYGFTTGPGFRIKWTSEVIPSGPPQAQIQVSDANPPINRIVQFNAEADNSPVNWQWRFGDGAFSSEQNPTHTYSTPGNYDVRLVVTNCSSLSDTVYQTILVQEAPDFDINPPLLQFTAGCGDTARATVQISNNGAGDLWFEGLGQFGDTLHILLYSYSVGSDVLIRMTEAIGSQLVNYTLDYFDTAVDSTTFENALKNVDMLVFPDMSNIDVSYLYMYQNVLQRFVRRGGSVVICGSPNFNNVLQTTNLLPANTNSSNDFAGYQLNFESGHPMTAGLPSGYFGLSSWSGHTFLDSNYVSLCSLPQFNVSLLGYKSVGAGKIVFIGFNYGGNDAISSRLMANTLRWCGPGRKVTLSPTEALVHAGATQSVEISLPTTGLFNGIYTGSLEFKTNETGFPTYKIPFSMSLSGQALFDVSPQTLAFNTVVQHASKSLQMTLYNRGCDTLFLQSVQSSNQGFAPGVLPAFIPPYAIVAYDVTFQPQDTGVYNGIIQFATNSGLFELPAQGYATGAPNVVFNPESLVVNLACGDSIVIPIVVSNSGLGNLSLQSTDAGGPNILMLDAYAYYYDAIYYTEMWARELYPSANIYHYINGLSIPQLDSLLQICPIVVLPGLNSPANYSVAELGYHLKPYMQQGGTVLQTGVSDFFLFNALGIPEINAIEYFFGVPYDIVLPGHPLVKNIGFGEAPLDIIDGMRFVNPGFVSAAMVGNFTTLGYLPYGQGKYIYDAIECRFNASVSAKIFKNALRWSLAPSWINAQPLGLTAQPGGSSTINVHINASALVEGQYDYTLKWQSNDPLQPVKFLPVHLNVSGTPALAGLTSELNYGTIQQFDSKALNIEIQNTGCGTLHLLQVTSSNPNFQAVNYPAAILGKKNAYVKTVFNPQTTGQQEADLLIVTDGGNYTTHLSGKAVASPLLKFEPDSITVALGCNDTTTVSVILSNTGSSVLEYSVLTPESPIKALAMTFGAAYDWPLAAANLRQTINGLTLSEYNGNSTDVFADSLQNKDLLIIPPLSNPSSPVYEKFAVEIQKYKDRGGQILVLTGLIPSAVKQLGVLPPYWVSTHDQSTLETKTPKHPILNGLPPTPFMFLPEFLYCANFETPVTDVAVFNNETYIGIQEDAHANIVYFGSSYYQYNNYSLQIMRNIFKWFAAPIPPGVTVQPNSGNIWPGQSQAIQLQFDGNSLAAGTYNGFLHLKTNAPNGKKTAIPIHFSINHLPCADFEYKIKTCSREVEFSDKTVNGFNTYHWDFGDSTFSQASSETHTYTSPGVYAVTLLGCNDFGCDTITKQVNIADEFGPVENVCTPSTFAYCCNAGILRVQLNELDHYSPDGIEGYVNNACTFGTNLTAGNQYPIYIITGSQYNENCRAWIDFDNNGNFSSNELVFNDQAVAYHQGFITVPLNAVINTPLRLRIISDLSTQGIPMPCSDQVNGQTEDYYVDIQEFSSNHEPDDSLRFNLYPNPTTGETNLSFQLPDTAPVTVEISDQAGRVIYLKTIEHPNPGANLLILPDGAPGVYVVKLQSGRWRAVQKLVRISKP